MNAPTIDFPPAAPDAAPEPRIRPGKVWYWVSAAVILLSALGAVAIWQVGRQQVESQVEGFARFLAPGSAELRFKRGGLYTLYYEYQGEVDGVEVTAPSMPPVGIELEMRDEADQSLELRRIGREFRYDASGFQGVSLRRVGIDRAGLYRIAATAPADAGTFAISVGRGDTPSTASTDQAAWLVGIIGGAIGVIGLITTGVLRSRARARAVGALPGQAPAGPPEPSLGPAGAAAAGWAASEPGRTQPGPFTTEPHGPPPATEPVDLGPAVREPEAEPSFAAPAPSEFSATAPLPPIAPEGSSPPPPAGPAEGSAPPPPPVPAEPMEPPPPPPAPTAPPPPPQGEAMPAPGGWGPPQSGTAADPFEVHEVPPPPPPPPPPPEG
jgi:hypothetical protein